MSSIYEKANIKAGDPAGVVSRNAEEAMVYLNQYLSEVARVEEINEALKNLENQANKKDGSILDGILGLGKDFAIDFVLGLATGGLGTIAQGGKWLDKLKKGGDIIKTLSGGLEKVGGFLGDDPLGKSILGAISGGARAKKSAEKRKEGLFTEVDALKKKYEGTKEYDYIDEAVANVENWIDETDRGDMFTEVGMGALFPTGDMFAAGDGFLPEFGMENLISPISGLAENETVGKIAEWGADSMLSKFVPLMNLFGTDKFINAQEGVPGQVLSALIKTGYSPFMKGMAPEYETPQLSGPQFTNPYNRRV